MTLPDLAWPKQRTNKNQKRTAKPVSPNSKKGDDTMWRDEWRVTSDDNRNRPNRPNQRTNEPTDRSINRVTDWRFTNLVAHTLLYLLTLCTSHLTLYTLHFTFHTPQYGKNSTGQSYRIIRSGILRSLFTAANLGRIAEEKLNTASPGVCIIILQYSSYE